MFVHMRQKRKFGNKICGNVEMGRGKLVLKCKKKEIVCVKSTLSYMRFGKKFQYECRNFMRS